MKWHPFVLTAALVLLLSAGAFGEYYQYTDENGVVRFTDDASLIPEDQRPDVKSFESLQREYSPQELEAGSAARDTEAAGTPNNETRKKVEELNALKEELRQTFNALEAEKKALGNPPSRHAPSWKKRQYNKKVTELNRKIDAYQKRREEFQEKIKAFNSQLTDRNQNR